MAEEKTYYPPVKFRFSVNFYSTSLFGGTTIHDTSFSEVSGLKVGFETEQIQAAWGNHNTLPTHPTHPNLILKRGVVIDSDLRDVLFNSLSTGTINLYDLGISLLSPDNQPVMHWHIYGAYPLSWEWDSLNAMESEVLEETLELAYAHMDMSAASGGILAKLGLQGVANTAKGVAGDVSKLF